VAMPLGCFLKHGHGMWRPWTGSPHDEAAILALVPRRVTRGMRGPTLTKGIRRRGR
jgi:hypothetical protein